jgi:hypothetical protein
MVVHRKKKKTRMHKSNAASSNMADTPDPHLWKSCCTLIDSRVLQFMAQSMMLFCVSTFCMVMLLRVDTCPEQQLFSGILTMVVGVFVPNPKIHH